MSILQVTVLTGIAEALTNAAPGLMLFGLVSLISFVGSVQPGPLSVAVVHTTLLQGRRAGLWLSLGGSLPELIYSALASGFLLLLSPSTGQARWLAYLPIPLLLTAGVLAFRQKPLSSKLSTPPSNSGPFWRGFILCGSSPQLLPFWSAIWLYLGSTNWLETNIMYRQLLFIAGSGAGAFAVLFTYGWLACRYREQLLRHVSGRWVNWLTGGTYLTMALWQVIRLARS